MTRDWPSGEAPGRHPGHAGSSPASRSIFNRMRRVSSAPYLYLVGDCFAGTERHIVKTVGLTQSIGWIRDGDPLPEPWGIV